MRIGELAKRAGVTMKAVRYYESLGLVTAPRLANGYRDYDDSHVRLIAEIGALRTLGIPVDEARPFIECLIGGHTRGDDCADSLGAYRRALDGLDERIDLLSARREALATALSAAEQRSQPRCAFSSI